MKKNFKLGIIGAGFMASAIIKGAINSGFLKPEEIIVTDKSDDARNRIASFNVCVADTKDVFEKAEYVLFAVKPQNFSELKENNGKNACKKFISIMAGVKKEKIKEVFPDAKVARCMPNTPCSVGYGAVGIDSSDFDKEDAAFVFGLFSSCAKTSEVKEDLLNTVTGISGSSPAYFYLFLKGLIEAGVKHGLDGETAKNFAANTMIGAGKMVLANSDKTLDELIAAVCSKGGTTIEAVKVYDDGALGSLTEKAVDACINRAEELEKL